MIDEHRGDGPQEPLPRDLELTVRRAHNEIYVRVVGEVDIASSPQLASALTGGATFGSKPVVLDLTGVTFIDSTGVRALLLAAEQVDGRLRVIPSPACRRVFELVGVGDRLAIDTYGRTSVG